MGKLTVTRNASGSRYTDDKRREAAATYLVLGNLRATARQTGVHERTLSDWVKSEWWNPLIQTLLYEKGVELDAKLTEVIDKALLNLTDRLDNGDVKMKSDGTMQRVPVSAKDCAIIAAVGFDKRQILRNQPTLITGNTNDRLYAIVESLNAMSSQPDKEKNVIESIG